MSSVHLPATLVFKAACNFQAAREDAIAKRRAKLIEDAREPFDRWSWRRLRYVRVHRTYDEAVAYVKLPLDGPFGMSDWDYAAHKGSARDVLVKAMLRLAEHALQHQVPTIEVDQDHIWLVAEYGPQQQ